MVNFLRGVAVGLALLFVLLVPTACPWMDDDCEEKWRCECGVFHLYSHDQYRVRSEYLPCDFDRFEAAEEIETECTQDVLDGYCECYASTCYRI
jgi:hypothetical protein